MRPEYVIESEALEGGVGLVETLESSMIDLGRIEQRQLDEAASADHLAGPAVRLDPVVTMIMPAYNVASWIERSIRSALAQTVRESELVIIDDASSDETVTVVRELIEALPAEEAARVRLIRQPHNQGYGPAFARGVQEARGEWVWCHDSDDLADPQLLQKLLDRAAETDAQIVVCRTMYVDEQGTPLGLASQRVPDGGVSTGIEALARLARGYLNGSQCDKLVHRSLWTDGPQPSTNTYADTDYMTQLLSRTERVAHCDEPLYFYTQRGGSVTSELSPRIFDLDGLSDLVGGVFDAHLDPAEARLSKLFFRYRWVYWHMLHKAVSHPNAALTPKAVGWVRSKIKFRELATLAVSGSPGLMTVIILGTVKVSPRLHRFIYRTYKLNAKKREAQS